MLIKCQLVSSAVGWLVLVLVLVLVCGGGDVAQSFHINYAAGGGGGRARS